MTTVAHDHSEATGGGSTVRAVIIGDSWIRGLGPERRRSAGKTIARALGAEDILDLAAISRTAPDVAGSLLPGIRAFAPTVAIVAVGGADSLVFPGFGVQRFVERFAPATWHGVEGLQPLVAYSRDQRRRRRQRIEQAAKMLVKQLLIHGLRSRRRIPLAAFEQATATILDALDALSALTVVVGFPRVDSWLSPKTNRSIDATNERLQLLCAGRPHALFVPSAELVTRWDDYLADHVHLSATGHEKVAAGVLAALERNGVPWSGLVRSAAAS